MTCSPMKVGLDRITVDQCSVIARHGSHAAAVFLTPHWNPTGPKAKLAGTTIGVSVS